MAKNRIREIRNKLQMSSLELAYKSGCSEKSINNYEQNRVEIPLVLARKIARILGVSLSKLFPDQE